jgi:hypothetical protein
LASFGIDADLPHLAFGIEQTDFVDPATAIIHLVNFDGPSAVPTLYHSHSLIHRYAARLLGVVMSAFATARIHKALRHRWLCDDAQLSEQYEGCDQA